MNKVAAPADFSPNNIGIDSSGAIPRYISLGDYLDEVNMPDNQEKLVMTYGDECISGLYSFLYMAGAISSGGTADSVTWWEDTRLHATADGVSGTTVAAGATTAVVITASNPKVFVGSVVTVFGASGQRPQQAYVTARTTTTYTIVPSATWGFAITSGSLYKISVKGSSFDQGTNQPNVYVQPNVVKRENTYGIFKDHFAVTGSQMTNESWVNIEGTNLFYHKGERDFRKLSKDYVELMHVFGEAFNHSSITATGYQGYIPSLEERGIVNRGYIEDRSDLEAICQVLDKEGGATEYTGFVSTSQQFKVDALASALTGNTPYGTFGNSKDMALQLGFKSLGLGGRSFHFQNWKVLNSPLLYGRSDYFKGVLVPNDSIKDSKTGIEAPLIEIKYKESGGYSRQMETWINGSAKGVYNNSDGFDGLKFEIRGEQSIITRAANRHVLLA